GFLFKPSSSASESDQAVADTESEAAASQRNFDDAPLQNNDQTQDNSNEKHDLFAARDDCMTSLDGLHQGAVAERSNGEESGSGGDANSHDQARDVKGLQPGRSRALFRYLISPRCEDPWSTLNLLFGPTDDPDQVADAVKNEL
ncbi:MAG: hypothetical protein M1830_004011, partial [Pleopsidium flavum]